MPAILCPTCGGLTNTAFRGWLDRGNISEDTSGCYLRVNSQGIWDIGCMGCIRPLHKDHLDKRVMLNGVAMPLEEIDKLRESLKSKEPKVATT